MTTKFFLPAAMCVGGVALMLLPLVVPVSFGGGLAGRPSLFPAWLTAVFFYTVMTVFVMLAGRAALTDLRRRKMRTLVQRKTIVVRLHDRTELAALPVDTGGVVRMSLREVKGGGRVRFVGRVSLRDDPSRVLGELIHDEGMPITEFEADLPGKHNGVLEWVTTEFDTETPTADLVRANVEIRLLVPRLEQPRGSARLEREGREA
jgi:hypothetical protein